MPNTLAVLVLGASALGAPVPAAPPPDPLGWGYLGVRADTNTLVISSVEPNTPAAKAGLREGDQFVRVGTLKPSSFNDVVAHIASFRPGSQLSFEVRRNGEVKAFTVRLGSRPASLPPPETREPVPPPMP